MLPRLCAIDSRDSPLVRYLLISWRPAFYSQSILNSCCINSRFKFTKLIGFREMASEVFRPTDGPLLIRDNLAAGLGESAEVFRKNRPESRGGYRFGQLSYNSFFARHNPHPSKVRHLKGESWDVGNSPSFLAIAALPILCTKNYTGSYLQQWKWCKGNCSL